ncbi:MAG: dihydropteroate synthase [Epsilonproteobacteria bacterium]|nr:dihydropteroate synthase [Campylobacterota bacterium]
MRIYRLGDIYSRERILKELGVHKRGIEIISNKMELLFFYIRDLKRPAVNILKQDALSIGAEVATPAGAILCNRDRYDCILIGNRKNIEILSHKELLQPFGLREVAEELQRFLKEDRNFPTQIMGIVNANGDSFYGKSRFKGGEAIAQIEKLIRDGADIIDIGGVSSRPNSEGVPIEEELRRVKPICDTIREQRLYENATFSIDSYTPKVIEYALKSGFKIVNDIRGASDDEVIRVAVDYGAKLSIMHMQGEPKNMQDNPQYDNVILDISDFFEERIEKSLKFGLKIDDIIIDVGIGFGKSLRDNLELIRNLSHFKRFGSPILIGASRKSLIDNIVPSDVDDRLGGTLAIHLKALENGADIIRCHDVKEHFQAISVWKTLKN